VSTPHRAVGPSRRAGTPAVHWPRAELGAPARKACTGGPCRGSAGPRAATRRGRALVAIAALAATLLLPAGGQRSAAASDRWESLRALPRVALEVVVSPHHPDLTDGEARARVTEALRRAQPAPALDPASPERLRLTIRVRVLSSDDLRGYPLPFSQQYGIGPVRLALERPATVDGLATPVAATVWQSERLATGPMGRSATEILGLVDEIVGVFLADYRRAIGQ